MSARVRAARPSDRADAVELWLALHREHEALDPRYRLDASAASRWRADVGEWIRGDAAAVWLAEADGAPVGLLVAHRYEPAPIYAPRPILFVSDLYVRPAHRRSGVAAELLTAARDWGASGGMTQVQVGVLAANAGALAFWERAGATPYSVTMTIDRV